MSWRARVEELRPIVQHLIEAIKYVAVQSSKAQSDCRSKMPCRFLWATCIHQQEFHNHFLCRKTESKVILPLCKQTSSSYIMFQLLTPKLFTMFTFLLLYLLPVYHLLVSISALSRSLGSLRRPSWTCGVLWITKRPADTSIFAEFPEFQIKNKTWKSLTPYRTI